MSEVRRPLAENLDAAQRVAARLQRSIPGVGALGPVTAATIERLAPPGKLDTGQLSVLPW